MKTYRFPKFIEFAKKLVDILSQEDARVLKNSSLLGLGSSTAEEYVFARQSYLRGRKLSAIPEEQLAIIDLWPSYECKRLRADLDLWVDGKPSDLTAVLYFDPDVLNSSPLELYGLRVL